jgi:type IV secretion system protein VirD4
MYKTAGPNVRAPQSVGAASLVPALLLLASLGVVSVITTQWEATQLLHRFANAPERLGECWVGVGQLCLYRPWSWLRWAWAYHYDAPGIFSVGTLMVALGFVALFSVSMIVRAVWRARAALFATTHGSATWERDTDYARAGFYEEQGVIVGLSPSGRYMRDHSDTHVAVVAPTGAGKGVGIVIPTLLNWTQSVFVYDFKGSNWAKSAGWRSGFSNAIYFAPTEPATSAHWNPLLEVRGDENQVRDVQNIADQLVDPLGKGKESHWDKAADMFFLGVLLHVLHAEADKSLYGVSRFLTDPNRTFLQTLERMKCTQHKNAMAHERISSGAQGMLNKSEDERSGVLSTALSLLGLYSDPIIARNTQDSDFTILDLMDAKHPMSLYLIVPESDRLRLKPFTRLMITMFTQRLVETLTPRKRFELLMLIDEFPRLGRMQFFADAVSYLREYGIKVVLVAQSLLQLEDKDVYGQGPNGVSDCKTLVVMAPQDTRTAEWISEKLGPTTVTHQQTTYSGHRWAFWLAHQMVSDQEVARSLLDPAEVARLPETDQIVMRNGRNYYAKKLRYYEIPELRRRSSIPPPALRKARPYPWRPQLRPSPWTDATAAEGTAMPATTPAGATSGRALTLKPALSATPETRDIAPRGEGGEQLSLIDESAETARRVALNEDSERKKQHRRSRGGPL